MNDEAQPILSLLEEHGARLHALLLRITLREDAAEDLMQELFLRLSRSRGWRRAADPVGYAVTTATRLAFDWRRAQRRRRDAAALAVEPASPEAAPSAPLERREEWRRVLDAIENLPPRQRDAVVLRYLEQRPYAEVASALNASVHHARALCHRGLVRLRQAVGGSVSRRAEGIDHES